MAWLLIGSAGAAWPVALFLPCLLIRLGCSRTNYRGQTVATSGGLLFVAAALVCLGFTSGPDRWIAAAAAGYGLLGFVDDRWGTAEHKGLRGHIRAALQGRLTTGFLKAAGGLAFACVLALQVRSGWAVLPAAPLIALSANLFNLLDLRPLRTLKAFWLLGAAALPASAALACLFGVSIPYARRESRREVMLGDTGSNALGGAMGAAGAVLLPLWAQFAALGLLLAFHAWTERHSFTAWIDAHPWARRIDRWGWGGGSELPRPLPPEGKSPEQSAAVEGTDR